SDVATGNQVSFTFALTAPQADGTYTTLWQMTTDGGAGFGPTFMLVVTVQGTGATDTPTPPPGSPTPTNSTATL
ncbi:MAG TPA: NBR1-Ig-like domain-containing protein, partial [Ktedonobacterales bacterium]|nr:NBR1-Ig-like domain-containing protein [Ktedonobacterales bacterium]